LLELSSNFTLLLGKCITPVVGLGDGDLQALVLLAAVPNFEVEELAVILELLLLLS
jgi:hypothetical protein